MFAGPTSLPPCPQPGPQHRQFYGLKDKDQAWGPGLGLPWACLASPTTTPSAPSYHDTLSSVLECP